MTRPFSSTDWSSIDGGSRDGRDGPRADGSPLAVLSLLLALSAAAAGCAAQEPDAPDATGGAVAVEVIRHGDGGASPVTLDAACRERLPGLVEEMLATASPVRLLIDEERIREVEDGGALEVVFDAERRFATTAVAETPARRVLLPLRDPYWVGTAERPFVVVFLGDESYGSGPWRNEDGLALLREIEACVRGESGGG